MKAFYKNADMACYYKMIEKNVNEFFRQEHKEWRRDETPTIKCPNIHILCNDNDTMLTINSYGVGKNENIYAPRKSKIVPMLAVQFVGTDSFDINNNICDYLRIDSTRVFVLASVDKHDNIDAYLHFFDGCFGYQNLLQENASHSCHKRVSIHENNQRHAIKKIRKLSPDLIMTTLFNTENIGRFLYVKDSDVFLYDELNNRNIRLDRFIKENYSIEKIRNFNKTYFPIIYHNTWTTSSDTRKTGDTPPEQINICR